MSKLFYLIGKSVANILTRPLSAVTSLLSMMLLFLLFDLVWISSLSADKYFGQLISNISMEIFLEDSLPDSTVSVVLNVVGGLEGVEKSEYISKEDAREKLHALIGTDLLEGLGENPLPRSINLTFGETYLNSGFLSQFEGNLKRLQGISDIYYAKRWLEKVEFIRSLTTKLVVFTGIVISLAVILNLLHSIRLSAKTREEELMQLRLLGARRSFLSVPYVLEGIFYALLASVAGWLIILYTGSRLTFTNFEVLYPSRLEIVYFCLTVAVVGMVGGYIGIRRSL